MKNLYLILGLAFCGCLYGCFTCDDDFIDPEAKTCSQLKLLGNSLFALSGKYFVTIDVAQPDLLVENNRQELEFEATEIIGNDPFVFINSSRRLVPYDRTTGRVDFSVDLGALNFCRFAPFAIEDSTLVTVYNNEDCFIRNIENGVYLYHIIEADRLVLEHSFPTRRPLGVALEGDWLFITDDDLGLSIYDISLPTPMLKHQLSEFKGAELSVDENMLLMVSDNRLYQFEFNIVENTIDFLSSLIIN